MNPIEKLFTFLSENNLLEGKMKEKAAFEAAMQSEAEAKSLYSFLRAKGVDLEPEDSFLSNLGVKKKPGGEGSQTTSSKQGAQDAGIIIDFLPEPAAQSKEEVAPPQFGPRPQGVAKEPDIADPFGVNSVPTNVSVAEAETEITRPTFGPTATGLREPTIESQIALTAPVFDTTTSFTGAESVEDFIKDKSIEVDPVRSGRRRASAIEEMAKEATFSANKAIDNLKSKYGSDWASRLAKAQDEAGDATPYQMEQKRLAQTIESDVDFKAFSGAYKANQTALEAYKNLIQTNEVYKNWEEAKELRQKEVDAAYESGGLIGTLDMIQNRVMRIASQTAGSILSAPGRAAEGIGGALGLEKGIHSTLFGPTELGKDIADIAEMYPKPSSLQRNLFEKTTIFDGLEVVVDNQGEPTAAYREGKRVDMDDQTKNRFKKSGAAKNAGTGVSGGVVLGDKMIDLAANLLLLRGIGGASKGGIAAASYLTNQEGAVREGIAGGLNEQDAALYGTILASATGLAEGYVGQFESGLFRQKAIKQAAEVLTKGDVLQLAGKDKYGALLKAASSGLEEVGGEIREELYQLAIEKGLNKAYNGIFGTNLDSSVTLNELAETVVLTSLLTGPSSLMNHVAYSSPALVSATMRAVEQQQKFTAELAQLVSEGAITQEKADGLAARVTYLSQMNDRLPADLDRQSRAYVLAAQSFRDAANARLSIEPMTEAEKSAIKAEIQAADESIRETLTNAPQYMVREGKEITTIEDKHGMSFDDLRAEYNRAFSDDEMIGQYTAKEVGHDLSIDAANAGMKKAVRGFYGEVDLDLVEPPQVQRVSMKTALKPIANGAMSGKAASDVDGMVFVFPDEATYMLHLPETVAADLPTPTRAAVVSRAAPDILNKKREPLAKGVDVAALRQAADKLKKVSQATNSYATSLNIKGSVSPEGTTPGLSLDAITDVLSIAAASGAKSADVFQDDRMFRFDFDNGTSAVVTKMQLQANRASYLSSTAIDLATLKVEESARKSLIPSQAEAKRDVVFQKVSKELRGPIGRYSTADGRAAVTNGYMILAAPEAEMQGVDLVVAEANYTEATNGFLADDSGKKAVATVKPSAIPAKGVVEFQTPGGDTFFADAANAKKLFSVAKTFGEMKVSVIPGPFQTRALKVESGDFTGILIEQFTNEGAETALLKIEYNGEEESKRRAKEVDSQATEATENAGTEPLVEPDAENPPQSQEAEAIEPSVETAVTQEADETSAAQEVAASGSEVELPETVVSPVQEAEETVIAQEPQSSPDAEQGPAIDAMTESELDAFIDQETQPFTAQEIETEISNTPIPTEISPDVLDILFETGRLNAFDYYKALESLASGKENSFTARAKAALDGVRALGTRPNTVVATANNLRSLEDRLSSAVSTDQRIAAAAAALNKPAADADAVKRKVVALRAAFAPLGVEIIVDKAAMIAALQKKGIQSVPSAVVLDGIIYIDESQLDFESLLHETQHVWSNFLKVNRPDKFRAGLEMMRDSIYERMVRASESYAHLKSDEDVLEEALALAIGERGAMIAEATLWNKFQMWMKAMFKDIAETFGLYDAEKATLNDFIEAQAYNLFRAKPGEMKPEEVEKYKAAYAANVLPQFFFVGGQYAMSDVTGVLTTAFDNAYSLLAAGATPNDVFQTTGLIVGPDGFIRAWRPDYFRLWIDAATAGIVPAEGEELQMRFMDVAALPNTIEVYPAIKDIQVVFVNNPTGAIGELDYENKILRVNTGALSKLPPAEFDSRLAQTIYHEIQHFIQNEEGHALGTSSSPQVTSAIFEFVRQSALASIEDNTDVRYNAAMVYLSSVATRVKGQDITFDYNRYKYSLGEVEARLAVEVQKGSISEQEALSKLNVAHLHPLFNMTFSEGISLDPVSDVQAKGLMEARIKLAMSLYNTYGDTVLDAETAHVATILNNHPQFLAARLSSADRKVLRKLCLAEIKANGLKNETATIAEFATKLGIPASQVSEAWAYATSVIYRTENIRLNTESPVPFKKRVKQASLLLKKYFNPKGLMNDAIFEYDLARNADISVWAERIHYLAADLESALKAEYGKSVPDAARQLVNAALTGDTDVLNLPIGIRVEVQKIRSAVDGLSLQFVYQGGLTERQVEVVLTNAGLEMNMLPTDERALLIAALRKAPYMRTLPESNVVEKYVQNMASGMGTYMHRSYRIHSEKGYADKIPVEVRQAAEDYISGQYKKQLQELIAAIDAKTDVMDKLIADQEAIVYLAKKKISDVIANTQAQIAAEQAKGTAKGDKAAIKLQGALNTLQALGVESERVAKLSDVDAIAEMDANTSMAGVKIEIAQIHRAKAAIARANGVKAADQVDLANKAAEIAENISNVPAEVDAILAKHSEGSFMTLGSLGSVDMKWLNSRSDIPKPIRELLGQYNDPTLNLAKTISGLSQMVANRRFLNDIAEAGKGKFFFQKPTGIHVYKIAADNSPSLAPLNGLYCSEEIFQALKEYYEPNQQSAWLKPLVKLISSVKFGKTILAPETQMRNFFGNVYFAFQYGWFGAGMSGFEAAASGWAAAFHSLKSDTKRAYFEKLIQIGVLDDGASYGDMAEFAANASKLLDQTQVEKAKTTAGKFLQKAGGIAVDAYKFGDNFWRILGYEAEKKRYANAWYKTDYDSLSPDQKAEVDRRAADIVITLLPTYSRVPKAIKNLKLFPLMGTFVSFPYETLRIGVAMMELTRQEMLNPATRGIGMVRAASIVSTSAMITGVVLGLMAKIGISEDEDKSFRHFAPSWIQNGTLLYTKKMDDPKLGRGYQYVNFSYSDPMSIWKKPIVSLMMDYPGGMKQNIREAVWDVAEPFFGAELTTGTIMSLWQNVDDRGNPIAIGGLGGFHPYNINARLDYAAKKLQPGFIKSLKDLNAIVQDDAIDYYGNKKTMPAWLVKTLTGYQLETTYVESAIKQKMVSIRNEMGEMKERYGKETFRIQKGIDIAISSGSEEAISRRREQGPIAEAEFYEIFNAGYMDQQQVATFFMHKSAALGFDKKRQIEILGKAGFDNKFQMPAILAGSPLPLERKPLTNLRD